MSDGLYYALVGGSGAAIFVALIGWAIALNAKSKRRAAEVAVRQQAEEASRRARDLEAARAARTEAVERYSKILARFELSESVLDASGGASDFGRHVNIDRGSLKEAADRILDFRRGQAPIREDLEASSISLSYKDALDSRYALVVVREAEDRFAWRTDIQINN